MNHSCVSPGPVTCVTWLIYMCNMTHPHVQLTHSYMQHDSSMRASHVRHDSFYVRHDSFICATWLLRQCATRLQQDSWICATWLIHTAGWRRCRGLVKVEGVCDMTCLYAWHDSFMRATWDLSRCVPWLIHAISGRNFRGCRLEVCVHTWLNHICDMTSSYVQHDSFASATWLMHTCDTTHS